MHSLKAQADVPVALTGPDLSHPDLARLSDDALFQRAHTLRVLALQGDGEARIAALACEVEERRRFGLPTTVAATLEDLPAHGAPWWRFWRRSPGSQ